MGVKVLCDTNAVTALRLSNRKVIETIEAADTVQVWAQQLFSCKHPANSLFFQSGSFPQKKNISINHGKRSFGKWILKN